ELLALAAADDRVLDDPEPVAFVSALADSSVTIGLRVWCATDDYLALSWALTEAAKTRFGEVGITIPFPQREVRTIVANA
ncbi:MAG: mechanosensitive ion channel family protein, partial [Erythrobacter sp.]|nr:mechanosensitive ion channel family protein [Erythrobacter sp.]